MTFSFSRAIEEPVLLAWQGKSEKVEEAQKTLLHVCKMNSLATQGKYDAAADTVLK